MDGGSLYGRTIGQLIRHGAHLKPRADETMLILLRLGADSHLSSLPGILGCSAILLDKGWD